MMTEEKILEMVSKAQEFDQIKVRPFLKFFFPLANSKSSI